jgi:2-oxoglutarate ferredoxin oxidoreductase subunit alpha
MDEIVGHLRENVDLPTDIEIYPRRKPKTKEGYKPYAPDEDLVPNIANFGEGYHIHVTGLIHDETGFPVGSPKVTREFIERSHKKISDDIIEVHTEFLDDAEEAVVSFGGTARTAYQAVLNARANGKKVGFIRLVTIWPFADKFFANLPSNIKKLVVAELNYGQVVNEVRRAVAGRCEVELCAKYDMTIFEPSEIEVCL